MKKKVMVLALFVTVSFAMDMMVSVKCSIYIKQKATLVGRYASARAPVYSPPTCVTSCSKTATQYTCFDRIRRICGIKSSDWIRGSIVT